MTTHFCPSSACAMNGHQQTFAAPSSFYFQEPTPLGDRRWTLAQAADWLDCNGIDANDPRVSRTLQRLTDAGALKDES